MTGEPIIWFPLSERQHEICGVAMSDPAFVSVSEISEMRAINLLQRKRDVVAACVFEPDPEDLWPVRDWSDEDDEGDDGVVPA